MRLAQAPGEEGAWRIVLYLSPLPSLPHLSHSTLPCLSISISSSPFPSTSPPIRRKITTAMACFTVILALVFVLSHLCGPVHGSQDAPEVNPDVPVHFGNSDCPTCPEAMVYFESTMEQRLDQMFSRRLEPELVAVYARLDLYDRGMVALEQKLAVMEKGMTEVWAKISVLSNKVESLSDKVESLSNRMESIETTLKEIQASHASKDKDKVEFTIGDGKEQVKLPPDSLQSLVEIMWWIIVVFLTYLLICRAADLFLLYLPIRNRTWAKEAKKLEQKTQSCTCTGSASPTTS